MERTRKNTHTPNILHAGALLQKMYKEEGGQWLGTYIRSVVKGAISALLNQPFSFKAG
ncbi:unnamed protein product [Nezara viridula]|uniref:Uncharacterized protein n=1 Tax=Nezara viridula TaxID=85310 RepID=A0A9P0E832_NEZVI|nr:unnamed protein product [Nezara viridula]